MDKVIMTREMQEMKGIGVITVKLLEIELGFRSIYQIVASNVDDKNYNWYMSCLSYNKCYSSRKCAIKRFNNLQHYELKNL